ncbi:hypothetical protein N431DRAFT_543443 [Stipitochalara longipes BDJ]|nr:hypothetical protein N431DRAFT_543443 [Stipitochalara longipes BDJ]
MKFSILVVPVLAGFAAAAIGDLCSSGGATGTCEQNSWCDKRQGRHNIKNLCPYDPDDVMCCFAPLCDNNIGSCDITTDSVCHHTGGHYVAGFCPGPADYQCCIYPSD